MLADPTLAAEVRAVERDIKVSGVARANLARTIRACYTSGSEHAPTV